MTKDEAIEVLATMYIGASSTEKEALEMAIQCLERDNESNI